MIGIKLGRYAGKPRFVVGAIRGQSGYAVIRVDGRMNQSDLSIRPVAFHFRTRKLADTVARRFTQSPPDRAHAHIALNKKQENMRRRHGGPPLAPIEPRTVFPKYLSSSEVGKILRMSTKTAIRKFEGLPGVIDNGYARVPTDGDTRTKYRILAIPEETVWQYIAEHASA